MHLYESSFEQLEWVTGAAAASDSSWLHWSLCLRHQRWSIKQRCCPSVCPPVPCHCISKTVHFRAVV